jgi:ABC-type transport system substrate-binding protein
VVGGLDERATKLRQAISIAIDQEEFISIFQNGRGIAAQSPLPPGISATRLAKPGSILGHDWAASPAQAGALASQLMAEAAIRMAAMKRRASRWWSISIPPAAAWAKNRASTG